MSLVGSFDLLTAGVGDGAAFCWTLSVHAKHRRKSDEVYAWTYFPGDYSDRPSDDRGINVGGSVAHLEVLDGDGNSLGFAGPSNQMNGKCIENCD